MDLVTAVYPLTARFPSEEKFGLVSQMRRCAVSVPSNIAEGQARQRTKEFLLFLSQANGSLAELETQAQKLGFVGVKETGEVIGLIGELQRMLAAMRRARRETSH
jgi:four helix bundle protein